MSMDKRRFLMVDHLTSFHSISTYFDLDDRTITITV